MSPDSSNNVPESTHESVSASEAVSREHNRIAQLLHDTVCQNVGAVHLRTQLLARRLRSVTKELADEATAIAGLVSKTATELEDMARRFRTVEVETDDLELELSNLARATALKIPCVLRSTGNSPVMDRKTTEWLFRLTQEALVEFQRAPGTREITIDLAPAELRVSARSSEDEPASRVQMEGWWRLHQQQGEMLGISIHYQAAPGRTELRCTFPPSNA